MQSTPRSVDRTNSCRSLACAASVLLAGCGSYREVARDAFVKMTTCPPDRVEVVQVPAPSWVPAPPAPPPEVAADPERRALWKERHAAPDRSGLTYYRTKGCGHDMLFFCYFGDDGKECDFAEIDGRVNTDLGAVPESPR
jgi:hypothetical protein